MSAASPARTIAKLTGTFHNISYYAPEMKAFAELGLPEYWRAYMAYRSAPLGAVPASAVTAMFYNFAPSRVAEAIPSAWDVTNPEEVMALRDRCIAAALDRALGDRARSGGASLRDTADRLIAAVGEVDAGARPLFAAHRDLPAPDSPLMRLWFACTLWREHRGDGHNIALAAAGVDGIECHLLLATRGVADQPTITKIRGWSPEEWSAANDRLAARGLVDAEGAFTDAGSELRSEIERHTDELAAAARTALGEPEMERAIAVLEPLVGHLIDSGVVPGRWPPPKPPA